MSARFRIASVTWFREKNERERLDRRAEGGTLRKLWNYTKNLKFQTEKLCCKVLFSLWTRSFFPSPRGKLAAVAKKSPEAKLKTRIAPLCQSRKSTMTSGKQHFDRNKYTVHRHSPTSCLLPRETERERPPFSRHSSNFTNRYYLTFHLPWCTENDLATDILSFN